MGLVMLRCRAELREQWRVLVVLALVVGLGGGVALTALAGARRADTAMGQFVTYSLPDDGGFFSQNTTLAGLTTNARTLTPVAQRVVDLPQVAAYFRAPYLFVTDDKSGRTLGRLSVIGNRDAALFRSVDRPLVLAGHLPDPSHPLDVSINEFAADQEHLHVGSHLRLYAYSAAQAANEALTAPSAHLPRPAGPSFRVRVTAVVRSVEDVNAVLPLIANLDVSYEGQGDVFTSPAFVPLLAAKLGIPVNQIPDIGLVGVRLYPGATWSSFARAARQVGGNQIFVSKGNVYSIPQAASSAQKGIHLEVVALLLFGVLALLVTLVLAGQAISRQVLLEAADNAKLRTLGAVPVQLIGVALLRGAFIGLGGGALSILIAALASPLMPIGLARQAEIHPGFTIDTLILVPGAFAIAALVAAWSAVPAWRLNRRALAVGGGDIQRPGWLAKVVARNAVPPPLGIGARFALESGHGPSAVPIGSALVAAVVAIATLAAALVFGVSLGHLVTSPRQQGWNWSVLVGNPNDLTDREAQIGTALAHNPYVESYSAIAILAGDNQGTAQIDGQTQSLLLAFDPLKGSVYPPLLEGHAPRADNQIVLGTQTLRQLHKQIGQSVQIAAPNGTLTLHIVGRMISPSVGDVFTNGLGEGGWVYGPAVRQHEPSSQNSATPPTVFNLFAVRFRPGVSPTAAVASLRREFGLTVLPHVPSEDVINLQSVDRLPYVLAGLVVLLGLVTVGNTVISSVRRRRRDLAILKTIGFTRRQVAAVVAAQATTFSLAALVVGIPIGIVAGRWAWSLVASNIGSVSPPVVPGLAIALIVPAALLLAQLVAAGPGWVAAKIAPAEVMRST
jgi:ABC-type lipoprotein release transport system permease subunit